MALPNRAGEEYEISGVIEWLTPALMREMCTARGYVKWLVECTIGANVHVCSVVATILSAITRYEPERNTWMLVAGAGGVPALVAAMSSHPNAMMLNLNGFMAIRNIVESMSALEDDAGALVYVRACDCGHHVTSALFEVAEMRRDAAAAMEDLQLQHVARARNRFNLILSCLPAWDVVL